DRGRVRDQRTRHGGDRADRARQGQDGRDDRDHRDEQRGAAQDGGDGGGDVPEDAGRGGGGGQGGGAGGGDRADGGGAGGGAGGAGKNKAAHKVQSEGVCVEEGGGRAAHAVLPRVPAAVLHSHDRRDWSDRAAKWDGDGDAGGQRGDGGGADRAGGDRGRAAVCHPRRWAHGRLGCRYQDHRVRVEIEGLRVSD